MKRALVPVLVGLVILTGATSGMTVVSPSSSVDESPPSAAASDVQAPVTSHPNATNVLRIPADELEATRIDVVSLSVGGGVAMDTRQIHTSYAVQDFETQFEAAETAAERRAALDAAVGSIDTRLGQLQREADTARQQFNDGGSSQVYLRTLGELHAEAATLERFVQTVSQRAAQVPETSVETELSSARTELRRFDGPVRATVASALRGETDGMRVYVATSADSVVLATIVDGEYLREVYRSDARPGSGTPTITLTEASRVVAETYPWAWENQRSLTAQSTSSAAVFSFQLQTPQGQLHSYVDARSEQVFREIQRQPLSTLYLRQQTTTHDGIRLAVNRSYGGGPMQLRLTNVQTNEPVDGTVRINGDAVGETGSDGTLWVVAPYRTNNITASAVQDGTLISVSTA